MTVGIKIGPITSEVGNGEFFSAFFDTIHFHLENGQRGEKFPILMRDFYQGSIREEDSDAALQELAAITKALEEFSPAEVIWDIENREAEPPWGDNISDEITNLSNYFVTSTGRDLLSTIKETLDFQNLKGGTIEVVTY